MRTSQETIDRLLAVLSPVLDVRARKMFGEYALYCDEKVVGLVCRDELVVKETPAGASFAGNLERRAAYPGSKPGLHIPHALWSDSAWLAELIQKTADALPKKQSK